MNISQYYKILDKKGYRVTKRTYVKYQLRIQTLTAKKDDITLMFKRNNYHTVCSWTLLIKVGKKTSIVEEFFPTLVESINWVNNKRINKIVSNMVLQKI